ncbi:hypothetical protein CTEN210_09660 [Chaetoceros tenuissimus]|uniref:Uncharacterized protein n=1 Tax=Chaetoceros tenuissimus TaxID=426638 RepID=A0AAD3CWI6_9STRA|nr:hypothetical protein CTEN210_09660 [Chaetoceros tenuissimus]
MFSNKRIRLEQGASAMVEEVPSATMNALPPEVMNSIFTYVGKGNFCFICPVSKDFCYNYVTMDIIEDKYAHKLDFLLAVDRNKVTTVDAASSSLVLAEHCFLNAPDRFQEKLFRMASRNGRQDIVTMAAQISGVDINDWICQYVIEEITKKGDLDMLVLLKEKGLNISSWLWLYHIIKESALHGHLDILRWLHQMKENIFRLEDILFQFAAEGGHLNIIKWGIDAEYAFNKDTYINHAATSGNLELVKWFRNQDISWNTRTSFYAVRSGNLELLQYLHDNGCVFTSHAFKEAVRRLEKEKVMEIFKWLRQQSVPWDEKTCRFAARRGILDALIYARTHGCPWDHRTIEEAVQYGHIDVVKYCLENDCPIVDNDLSPLTNSDYVKDLKVLKLLRKFNIPWNEVTCEVAICSGNLEALKWIRSQGCPWNECAFECAIESNDMTTIQYCIENECPFGQRVYPSAVTCKDPIPILKLLRSNGYEWNARVCTEAAIYGKLKVLRWLRYHNCPWDEGVCNAAVKTNRFDILVYAHENKCPWTKETYAYCFHGDGLDGEFNEIPTEHKSSNEIIEYLRKT